MLAYLLRRLAWAIPTLLAVSFLVFIAVRLAPSSPVEAKLGEKATPEQREQLLHHYGLDQPLLVQYFRYIGNIVLHGDFGESYVEEGRPVTQNIKERFPVTACLAITALLFAALLGLPAGALAAYYHNSWFDRALMAIVVALVSVPSIVLGPLLIYFIAVQLRWLPVSGWESVDVTLANAIRFTLPLPRYLVLPTIALGARSAALLARFMRASLLETLRQDYVRTAIAKGLTRAQAVRRHALKNAFLPVLTVLGTNFGALLTGSFVVETMFQIPGIGYDSINSISTRDYPVIQGIALLVASIYLLVNLGVDLLYGVIDPRIRQEAKA
ncbi:MAG TPA: ABC transporter permease [Chthonomonadaceae bacterium]|nr:ABC transporter permease [Chthonomonadaceae bacterium]